MAHRRKRPGRRHCDRHQINQQKGELVMTRIFTAAVAALVLAFGIQAHAQKDAKKGTAAEATAMVQKAVAHIKKVGRDKAFADFSSKKEPWVDRDLYVVVYDLKGRVLAHGANEKMIGKDVI